MMFVDIRYLARIAMGVGLGTALSLSCAYAAPAADDAEAQAQESWRESIVQSDGCFHAAYPSTEWLKVPCAAAKNASVLTRISARPDTVGDGTDWSAGVSSGLISHAIGSFPKFKS